VVDHYGLDEKWESAMRPACDNIMVIDDLADRPHDCDLLLDQNYFKDRSARYDGLVPPDCQKLLGPEYALLREEFRQARPQATVRDGNVRRVLVFMSGADPTDETAKVLRALRDLGRDEVQFDVVIGGSNRHARELTERYGNAANIVFHHQVNNMAQLMLLADLAVGGGGTTTWERCYLGLPSLTMVMADNQARMTQDLAEYGAVQNLGRCEDVTADRIAHALEKLLENPPAVRAMSEKAMQVMGGARDSGVDLVIGAMLGRLKDTAKADR
jgi:UDP-2,4-diacetamido-2,4,6-trideoxy-beta-L-altropyranose hydrolase